MGVRRTLLTASPEDRLLLQRYSDGVNAGLTALSARPADYLLTLSRPRPWSPADSLLVSWAIYFDLQDNLEPRKWGRGWIRDHATPEQLAFLLPDLTRWDAPLDAASPTPEVHVPDTAPAWWNRPAVNHTGWSEPDAADSLPGSNNWAIAGSRSSAGRAILANDMHLSLALPPIWYRLQIGYSDDQGVPRKLVGVSLPGAPLIVVGSNGHVAWGFTNAAGDWLDLLRLDQDAMHPGQVQIDGQWLTPDLHEETILVKDAEPDKLLIHETPLGPLRNLDGQVYAVHWLALAPEAVPLGLRQLESADSSAAHRSTTPPRRSAANNPPGTPSSTASTVAAPISSSVRGRRCPISAATGLSSCSDCPRSPVSIWRKFSTYCAPIDRSRPSCSRSAATAAGSGATPPCDSRISAGSPGTSRIARNTMLATSQIRPSDVATRLTTNPTDQPVLVCSNDVPE